MTWPKLNPRSVGVARSDVLRDLGVDQALGLFLEQQKNIRKLDSREGRTNDRETRCTFSSTIDQYR